MLPTRLLAVVLGALVALNITPLTRADGKIFARASAIVEIPDQEALIHFAHGVETLVIETRFTPVEQSAASDLPPYAWVVPVPGPRADGGNRSAPEVFAVTTGLFPTLRALCAPRIEHNITQSWVPICMFCGLLITVMLIKSSIGTPASVKVAAALFCFLIIGAFMLPTLGKASSSLRDINPTGVEIYERCIVGSFDVAVVGAASATSSDDLLAWLAAEGFMVPPEARSVAADYARRGWVFVAAKLRSADNSANAVLTPHPLGIRFHTRQAVYPMRLTAVGDLPLALDLYIASDRQARVPSMRTLRCANIEVKTPERIYPSWPRDDSTIVITHRQVAALVSNTSVLTKLSANFAPEQMDEDLTINWTDPEPSGGVKYSAHGASTLALNWVAALWLVGIIIMTFVAAFRRWPDRDMAPRALAILAPCLLVGLCLRLALSSSTTDTKIDARGRFEDSQALVQEAVRSMANVGDQTADEVRGLLAAQIRKVREDVRHYQRNVATLPLHEDSPHNYIVREGSSSVGCDVIYIDSRGQEVVVGTINR